MNRSMLIVLNFHYSFDVSGRAFSKALYWSDTNAFGPRAYFLTVSKPATLSVDNVQLDDEGVSIPHISASFFSVSRLLKLQQIELPFYYVALFIHRFIAVESTSKILQREIIVSI